MKLTPPRLRAALVALALLFAYAGASAQVRRTKPLALAPGDAAPELRGTTSAGERVLVDYATHELTLVNFWAPWCEPCKEEMPALQGLVDEFAPAGKLQVVGIVQDKPTPEDLEAFLASLEIDYANLYPWPRAWEQWGEVRTLPTSFLIRADGTILRRYVGSTPAQLEGLLFDIRSYLDGNGLGPYVFPD